jgi:predicted AlkP superfamily pyrophosphatase or phosphodiesterase
VAVDQLRADYLVRFRDGFTGGFARLLAGGAVFTNAHLEHYPTVTAVGHAAMLTGSIPAASGIIGNDWFDREAGQQVTSVSDPGVALLGGTGQASSPHRLLVTTVADELKLAGRASRAIGVSFKDRAAILPAGRGADGAFWLDGTGAFVSSTWYFPELPAWARAFNERRLADAYAGAEWKAESGGAVLRTIPAAPGRGLVAGLWNSPFGNELLAAFAEAALEGERLGQGEGTDVLTVSFSANDSVGHAQGPDSPAVREITVQTDRILGRLLAAVDRRVGLARTLVVLTSDHGLAPVPEEQARRRMPGGRMTTAALTEPVEKALAEAFGPGPWILSSAGSALYLDLSRLRQAKLDEAEVQAVAARALQAVPHVSRVLTRTQLLRGEVPDDPWCRRILRGYHPRRGGDLEVLLEPYWMRSSTGTTHGTPYAYDTHVPLVIMGPGIRPGRHARQVALQDLAPTLSALLEVEPPSGSAGRVLGEALVSGATR